MADDRVHDQVAELVESYIAYLDGDGPAPSLDGLAVDVKREAHSAFRAADAAWRSDIEIPPLEEDPVALALGFVGTPGEPDAMIVTGASVRVARRRQNLKASDVAKRLSAKGFDVNQQWLVRLERASVQEIPFDLASGLAAVLRVSTVDLQPTHDKGVDAFGSWVYSEDFDAAFAHWVTQQEDRPLPIDLATRARRQLLAAARRSAGEGEPALWVALLRSVLDELS